MVGGQLLDLDAEERAGEGPPTAAAVRAIQERKTGALIAFAAEAGAILAAAGEPERAALRSYGMALGAAFQIADDLLDAEGSAAVVGKAAIMDAPLAGGLGGTYAGSPIACAAALAVLEVIEEERLCAQAETMGARMVAALRAAQQSLPVTEFKVMGETMAGTIQFVVILVPPAEGAYSFSIWVTDASDNDSNRLDGSFTAQ